MHFTNSGLLMALATTVAALLPSSARADPGRAEPATGSSPPQVASLDTNSPGSRVSTPSPTSTTAPAGTEALSSTEPSPPPPGLRTMDNAVTAFGVLGYGYSGLGSAPGVGVRFQKRLARGLGLKGPKVHDDISFEGGVDYVHYTWSVPGFPQYDWSYNEVSVLAGMVYNVWLGDAFVVYPKIELAYAFGSGSSYAGVVSPSYGGLWFQGAGGAAYKLGALALRGEFGWRAVRLGVGYTF